jgi:non-specific protein-tyrosine kinase
MNLRDYLKVLRKHLRLIIASVVVVTVVAVGLSLTQKKAYQGVALILVTQQDTGLTVLGTPQTQDSYQPGRDVVQTQVEVIQSSRIAELVIQSLGLHESPTTLLGRVTASADTGTDNITITAIDPTPEGAARLADAFAAQYVAWSRDSQTQSIQAAAGDVQKRLTLAQQQITSLEQTATKSGGNQAQLAAAQSLYTTLADKLEQLRIAQQLVTGAGSVLANATVDPTPVSPKPTRDGTLGLALGLLLGLLAAFVTEQLDVSIKSPAEASEIYHAPVLANIPIENVSKEELSRLTLADRPGSPAAESYRMLRNNLGFVNYDKGIKTMLVTSAVPSEGKSTVAANLATVLARAGGKVILVVCDFYLPAAERFFEIDYSVGLSNVLAGTSPVQAAIQHPAGFENLAVMPSGPQPPNPSELLSSEAMHSLVVGLRESADWVILDSAPVLAAADASATARWVDGVLVVSRLSVTKRDEARAGYEQLKNVGARILGLAVWGPMDTVPSLGFYGYHDPSAR